MLLNAVPGLDRQKVGMNLRFLARQHQDPGAEFPLITDPEGMKFFLDRIDKGNLDLIILDNFSTLGEVEDENSASSFNAIQQFLLGLKVAGVATMLVHHAGKSGDFRGSSKLAATFETIIKLERIDGDTVHGEAQFRVEWDKVRAGGPRKKVQTVFAKLITSPPDEFGGAESTSWEFEAAELGRPEDIRDRLSSGEFKFFREIGDLYGVTKQMATKYCDKAKRLGLWTEQEERMWLIKGKALRTSGKTQPPINIMASTFDEDEPLDDEASIGGEVTTGAEALGDF
jgi:AAA domain